MGDLIAFVYVMSAKAPCSYFAFHLLLDADDFKAIPAVNIGYRFDFR